MSGMEHGRKIDVQYSTVCSLRILKGRLLTAGGVYLGGWESGNVGDG